MSTPNSRPCSAAADTRCGFILGPSDPNASIPDSIVSWPRYQVRPGTAVVVFDGIHFGGHVVRRLPTSPRLYLGVGGLFLARFIPGKERTVRSPRTWRDDVFFDVLDIREFSAPPLVRWTRDPRENPVDSILWIDPEVLVREAIEAYEEKARAHALIESQYR